MWKKIKKSSDQAMVEKFRKFRQHIKMWVRSERKQYLVKDVAKSRLMMFTLTAKRFWSFFSFKNKNKPIPDKLHYGSDVLTDDHARATAFSTYFQSIYSDHDFCIGAENDLFTPLSSETLDLIQVSLHDVTSLLQSINVRESIGPDGLPNIILKGCANSFAPFITALINCGLRYGLCSTYWKFVNVTAIHKKNKQDFVSNYRPILVLPVISKLQEHLIVTQLINHISEQIYPFQHGFQRGKSCVSQLLHVFHKIGMALDTGLATDLILTLLRRLIQFTIKGFSPTLKGHCHGGRTRKNQADFFKLGS